MSDNKTLMPPRKPEYGYFVCSFFFFFVCKQIKKKKEKKRKPEGCPPYDDLAMHNIETKYNRMRRGRALQHPG